MTQEDGTMVTARELADCVTQHMLKLQGIVSTTTLIPFRSYSCWDLEHLFSIGMEKR